jgi:ubiquinone/menaquinone biosynthesis C-methylase UbiE
MNEILKTFLTNYHKYKKIEPTLDTKTVNKEVEARFEIDYQITDILKKLYSLQTFNIEEENTVVEYHDKYRIIYSKENWENNPKKRYGSGELKEQILYEKINLQGYPINLVYSHEIKTDVTRTSNPKIRYRQRYIINNFINKNYSLHLTQALDTTTKKYSNHIEIEYKMENMLGPADFILPIQYIFDLMYVKSLYLLEPTIIYKLIDTFNSYLSSLKRNLSSYDRENMSKRKLVNYEDKPIGMTRTDIDVVKTNQYFVTNKLNGTRYYLFIIQGEFFLIGKNGSKISTIPTLVWKIFQTDKIDPRKIFILDGEYFDENFLSKNKLYFAFDMIWHDNIKLDNLPYQDRLNYLYNFTKYIFFSPVEMKYITYGNNIVKVIAYMKNKFGEEWNINNDGLIFTPRNSIYANKSFKTLKWKFSHHQSVDVSVKNISPNLYECYVLEEGNKLLKFTDYLLFSSKRLIENSIVEVIFDSREKRFLPLRLRPDKEFPNFKTVAQSFLKDITDEIKLSELLIKELTVDSLNDWKIYRQKCANVEKNKLIKTIDKDSIIVDIGFGKGGDLFKYVDQGIQRIIAIEPNFENIQEFFYRMNITQYRSKSQEIYDLPNLIIKNKKIHLTLIYHSAVDKEIPKLLKESIGKDKNNVVITMFFSLTYFFNEEEDFVNLIRNLCAIDALRIIGTVMDGEKTKEFLQHYFWNYKNCGLELKIIEENKVYISIAESATVQGHNEYLTDLNRLKNILEWYNFKLINQDYFQFTDLGENNLLTQFAKINCSFQFYSSAPKYNISYNEKTINKPLNHMCNINDLIIQLNKKLAFPLDSLYFYHCFKEYQMYKRIDIGELITFVKHFEKLLSKYFIEKVKDKYYFNYNSQKIEIQEKELNKIRYFILTKKINDSYKFLYTIKKYKLLTTNQYFNIHYNTGNIFNIIKGFISPIKEYNILEINPGVGNFTIKFIQEFKNITTFSHKDDLNFQCLEKNIQKYFEYPEILEKENYNLMVYNDKTIELYYKNFGFIDFKNIDVLFLNLTIYSEFDFEYLKYFSNVVIISNKLLSNNFENYELILEDNYYIYLINNEIKKLKKVKSEETNETKKDIKKLLEVWPKKTFDLIMKNLKFSNITEKEVDNILSKYESDNDILFHLNKLRFSKDNNKENKEENDSDMIRGKARVREIKTLFQENDIYLETNKYSKYLDIGSGNGIITKTIGNYFKFSFENIYGVEITKWMEKDHQDNKTAIKTSYIVGDILPFDDNSFELVTCIMSIHHFEYREKMLNEIERILKPNGLLLVRDHEYDYTKELKDLIDLEHALFATVIHEKMDINQINDFWKTYIGEYFSFSSLQNDLTKRNFIPLNQKIYTKGPTNYYWCAFMKQD